MEEGRRENGVIGTKYQDKKERRYKKRNSKQNTPITQSIQTIKTKNN